MGWRTLLQALTGRRAPGAAATADNATPPPPAARGLGFALLRDHDGDDACVGCGLCAAVCPVDVIDVRPGVIALSPHTGRPRGTVERFRLDATGCIACELCMQVCPTDALRLFPDATAIDPCILDLAALRANATRVRRGPRRSPLGPAPGTARAARGDRAGPPLVSPSAPRSATPTPALDLGAPGAGLRHPAGDGLRHPAEVATGEPTRMEHFAHPVDAPTEHDDDSDSVAADPGDWLPVTGPHPDELPTGRPTLDGVDLSDQLDSGVWLESDDELVEFSPSHPQARRSGGPRRAAASRDRVSAPVEDATDDPTENAADDPTENAADDPTENLDPDRLPGDRR